MSHPLRALMPQVSNLSMLGAPIVVQIMALLYSRTNLSDVLPPAANVTISNVLTSGRRCMPPVRNCCTSPGVDLDPRLRSTSPCRATA